MSWMIISKATGKAVFEAKSEEVLNTVNLNAYHAVPSADFLEEIAKTAEANCPSPQQVEGLHLSAAPTCLRSSADNCPGHIHHSRNVTGAPFSVDEARHVIRQPERSDKDIKAACDVLRGRGNFMDDWIVDQITAAMEQTNSPIEVA